MSETATIDQDGEAVIGRFVDVGEKWCGIHRGILMNPEDETCENAKRKNECRFVPLGYIDAGSASV